MPVEVAEPVCAKFKTERPPEKVEVAEALVTESCGEVRRPVDAIDVVPVCPKEAVFASVLEENSVVEVALVVVRPPANDSSVVVEFPTNGYENVK